MFKIEKLILRELLAEAFGTFIFLSFGLGAVAQHILYENSTPSIAVNLAFCFGITLGILIAGNITGFFMINTGLKFSDGSLRF